MSTVTKTFAFLSNAESFSPTGGVNSTLIWSSSVGNPAGSLESSVSGRNKTDADYWEWTGTWEQLGVPVGATVTSVRLTSASNRLSTQTHPSTTTIGPYDLRDSSGVTVIGTLWAGRSATTQEAAWTTVGAQSPIDTTAYQASNTTIKIRLADTVASGNNNSANTKAHDDQVSIEMTYTDAVATKSASDSGTLSATETSSVSTPSNVIIGAAVVYNNTVASMTVPSGVTATDTAVFVIGGSTTMPASVTLSKSGVTFNVVQALIAENNMWSVTYKATGLVAGDTVDITQSINQLTIASHMYLKSDIDVVGTKQNRGGVSSATITAPSITTTAGQPFYIVGMERTVAAGTITSIVNSNGIPMTNLFWQEDSGSATSTLFARGVATGTSSGTTTVTYESSSGNGTAYHFSEVVAGSTTPKSGNDTGTFSATESSSVSGTGTISDSGTLSAVEANTLVASSTSTDSGSISATDSSSVSVSVTATDTGAISSTDASSIGTSSSTKSGSDSGTFNTGSGAYGEGVYGEGIYGESGPNNEVATIVVIISSTDTGTLSATEGRSISGTAITTDTGTLSSTESRTIASISLSTDAGTLSITESTAIVVNVSGNDSGAVSVTESTSISSTSASTDSGTLSATELATILATISSSDSGTLSATDSTMFGELTKGANDSGTLSATESASVVVSVSRADSGTFSGVEGSSSSGTMSSNDGGTLSASESTFGNVQVATSDTGTFYSYNEAYGQGPYGEGTFGAGGGESGQMITSSTKSTSDTGTMSATETSSVSIIGTVIKSATDSGTFSSTDTTVGRAISVFANDSGTMSISESSQVRALLTRPDSGTLSAIEVAAETIVNFTSGDTGTLSIIEVSGVGMIEGFVIQYWNGSSFNTGIMKFWDGSSFITSSTIWYWNGTEFIQL